MADQLTICCCLSPQPKLACPKPASSQIFHINDSSCPKDNYLGRIQQLYSTLFPHSYLRLINHCPQPDFFLLSNHLFKQITKVKKPTYIHIYHFDFRHHWPDYFSFISQLLDQNRYIHLCLISENRSPAPFYTIYIKPQKITYQLLSSFFQHSTDNQKQTIHLLLHHLPLAKKYTPNLYHLHQLGLVRKLNSKYLLKYSHHFKKIELNHFCLHPLKPESHPFYSPSQKAIINIFCQKPNKYISKPVIAKTIWPPNTDYSEWAIDQFICRLRKKIQALSNCQYTLLTNKSVGIKFSLCT